MDNGVLSIAHKGEATDLLLALPAARKHLSTEGKKNFKRHGDALIKAGRLRETHLLLLEVLAEASAQFEWACNAINKKNKEAFGTGYIQTYKTGATNITTEMAVRNDAADTILKCAKQFGLDPKSEKELKVDNTGQLDLFESYMKAK